jgi:hypothetical protein
MKFSITAGLTAITLQTTHQQIMLLYHRNETNSWQNGARLQFQHLRGGASQLLSL